MYKILEKDAAEPDGDKMVIEAPLMAKKAGRDSSSSSVRRRRTASGCR